MVGGACALALAGGGQAVQAAPLINGLGGSAGYGEGVVGPCDDCSSGALPLPFNVNFYGTTYNTFYVNNNGNISFGGPYSNFIPNATPAVPMIAAFWQDVHTSLQPQAGLTYYNVDEPSRVVVTWNNVGRYFNRVDLLNNFQLELVDRGGGNFNIQFIYDRLQWFASDSSPSGAFVGVASGTGLLNQLPESLTSNVLNLDDPNTGIIGFELTGGAPRQLSRAPGPLPVIGAMAALGWSRRLRNRSKTSGLA